MAVIAGIDEAGYGPLLGPLVIGCAVFEVPDGDVDRSLWRLLAGAVCRTPSAGRVCIADSKRLYAGLRGAGGLALLECGVLAMLQASGGGAGSLRELVARLAPGAVAAESYPWYCTDLALPAEASADEVFEHSSRVARRLAATGIRLLELRAEPVFEAEFNASVGAERLKSDLLLEVACRLLRHLRRRYPEGPLLVHLDRQGGRRHYLAALQGVFDGKWIWALREDAETSVYRVDDGERAVELAFTVEGETHQLPVALASMTAKYLRELYMRLFNRYWCEALPGIAPTAGYYGDGRRFLADVAPALERLGVSRSRIVRCK